MADEKDKAPPAKTDDASKGAEATAGKASGKAETEDTSGKIKVKVTAGKGSGSYVHPVSKQLLLRDGAAQLVPNDDWTDQMIRDKYLTEVRR